MESGEWKEGETLSFGCLWSSSSGGMRWNPCHIIILMWNCCNLEDKLYQEVEEKQEEGQDYDCQL